MMNKKGQMVGVALALAAFLFIIVLFTTIDPLKEALDDVRDTTSLNCRGTVTFNETAFDNDDLNKIDRLTRRPTCFATGLTLVWFIGAFLVALVVWMGNNFRKKRRIIR